MRVTFPALAALIGLSAVALAVGHGERDMLTAWVILHTVGIYRAARAHSRRG